MEWILLTSKNDCRIFFSSHKVYCSYAYMYIFGRGEGGLYVNIILFLYIFTFLINFLRLPNYDFAACSAIDFAACSPPKQDCQMIADT